MLGPISQRLRSKLAKVPELAVTRGVSPAVFGYRFLKKETVADYCRRAPSAASLHQIHAQADARHNLPRNIAQRELLPKARGWWGYSFYDVPERTNGPTFLATLPDCRVVPSFDSKGQFWATIVNQDKRAVELRELSFRGWQARFLRNRQSRRIAKATWLVERVYDNYSHWLTAHLPKLLMLRDLGLDEDVLLPTVLAPLIHQSLEFFGLPAQRFPAFDPAVPLKIKELTVVGTDRFRPELLRLVARHCPLAPADWPTRRIFISRAGAARRRLVNEADIWPILAGAGFERVQMERMTFCEQVALMRETAVLIAPHGAGLTNMMFCPEGCHVVEIADLAFPNPNFYAVASAMGHHYWLIEAETSRSDPRPLERDLWVDSQALVRVLEQLI